jgi:hypothetical protein
MIVKEHTDSNLVIKETAGCIWLFGLFFVIISLTVIAGLLGMFTNLDETEDIHLILSWLVSLAALTAGIWIIYSNPVIYMNFDKDKGAVNINRRGIMRNETESYSLDDINDIMSG